MASRWLVLLLCFIASQVLSDELDYSRELMRDQASLLVLAKPVLTSELMPLMQSSAIDSDSLERDYQTLLAAWRRAGFSHSVGDSTLVSRLVSLEPDSSFIVTMNRIRHLLELAEQPWRPLYLGGWLRPGDTHRETYTLAKKLWLLGDLVEEPQSGLTRYDGRLVWAVQSFQRRHGLLEDAIVGPKTLYWLNLAPKDRARRLAIDYLQSSHERRQLPPSYVLVNIPAFALELVDGGEPLLHSRVIVGRPSRKTPFIQSEISAVVVNPSWRVPNRLMRRDVLPKVRQDGSYLARKNFIVWTHDGQAVHQSAAFFQQAAAGSFPYRLEQRPGPGNALGRFKLHFANDDSVYLHDTPEKHLFNKPMRALSSGCVRVEKIAEITEWLANHRIADRRRWQQSLRQSKTRWFALKESLPVHFVYWTSWVDSDGTAQFREDIYGLTQDNQFVASK